MNRSTLHIGIAAVIASCLFGPATRAFGQNGSLPIYTDSLQSGWQNWSWATVNLTNASPTHSGTTSISVTAGAWQALFFHHDVQDSTPYGSLSFWVDGGPVGGQQLQVVALLSGVANAGVPIAPLISGWQHVTVPLAQLGADNKPDLDGFWIMDGSGSTQPAFYVDDVSLTPSGTPLPTSAKLSVNSTNAVKAIDSRMYGMNTAVWDFLLDTPDTVTLLGGIGTQALRYPGGSVAEDFDWSTDRTNGHTWTWTGNPGLFANLVTQTSSKAYVTVNYGSGTPQMAAAWVAWANASTSDPTLIGVDSMGRDWKTAGYWASMRATSPLAVEDGLNFLRQGRSAPYGFTHWEIGNEVYGNWETDNHGVTGSGLTGVAHDPTTYATAFKQFSIAMKAVDPSIKLGAVAITGEDSYGTGLNPVPNPNENNKLHSGWTPVMLSMMAGIGIKPDFLSYHRYPQRGSASDYVALFEASRWDDDAANLRQMLTDYLGAAGSDVELDATEHNLIADPPVKQLTSLVDGLYYADSFGYAVASRFDADLWYTLHNGAVDSADATLYGWRSYGDFGMLAAGDKTGVAANSAYPAFYGAKLSRIWASPGDTVVSTATDYPRLTVHAVHKQNGHLALLVVNKSPNADLTGHIDLGAFSGAGSASVYSYGKANDTNQTDVTHSTVAVNGNTLDYVFPSYSMTVIDLPYGHKVAQGIQMLSAPYDYSGTAIGSLLGSGTKLYSWNPTTLIYDVTPSAPADTFHLGKAYWAKPSTAVTVTVQGTPAPAGTPFRIPLKPGWNMIGDPFGAKIVIGSLGVETATASTATPIASSSAVSLPLYAFNGTGYVGKIVTDTIDPYQGYWIYAKQTSMLVVTAP